MSWPEPPQRSGGEVLELLRATVEPVLVPRGFAPAQGGVVDGELGVTWCAAYDGLAARSPLLSSSGEQPAHPAACVDIVLTGRHDGVTWRLISVELEGQDLGASLRHVGDPAAAARAGALPGSPLEPSLGPLQEVLEVLFVLGRADGEVMRQVAAGESFMVANDGRPANRLVPVPPDDRARLIAVGVIVPAEEPFDAADRQPLDLPSAPSSEEVLRSSRGDR